MRTCLHALESFMRELYHVLDASFLRSVRQLCYPLLCQACQPLGHAPSIKTDWNKLYGTCGTTAGLHWAAYTWHWCIDVIFVWMRNIICPSVGDM